MHDLIWKFWAASEMALDICKRELYIDKGIIDYDKICRGCWSVKALCQILKYEWVRDNTIVETVSELLDYHTGSEKLHRRERCIDNWNLIEASIRVFTDNYGMERIDIEYFKTNVIETCRKRLLDEIWHYFHFYLNHDLKDIADDIEKIVNRLFGVKE